MLAQDVVPVRDTNLEPKKKFCLRWWFGQGYMSYTKKKKKTSLSTFPKQNGNQLLYASCHNGKLS